MGGAPSHHPCHAITVRGDGCPVPRGPRIVHEGLNITTALTQPDHDRGKALLTAYTWIKRRVESVELHDSRKVRRAVTVDFIVPKSVDDPRRAPTHLPVVLLRKIAPVLDLDLRDEDSRALPLLTKQENAAYSGAALASALAYVTGIPASHQLLTTCQALARDDPAEAAQHLGRLTRWVHAQELPRDEDEESRFRRSLGRRRAMFIARSMAGNSFIWLRSYDHKPLERRVIKFAYDETLEVLSPPARRFFFLLGFRSLDVGFATPHLRGCCSYHFELAVPSELEMHGEQLHAEIRRSADGSEVPDFPTFFKAFDRDLHLYLDLTGTYTEHSGGVAVKLRASRHGFLSMALAAAWLICAMLWTAWLLRSHLTTDATQVIPPVFLITPAVLVALVNRPNEHPFNAFVLTGTRYLVLVSGVIASAAAGVLAFVESPGDSEALSAAWLTGAIATTAIATIVLAGWIASMPKRLRAWSWAAISTAVAAGLMISAAMTGEWTGWRTHLTLIPVVALIYCATILFRRIQRPTRSSWYLDGDLRHGRRI